MPTPDGFIPFAVPGYKDRTQLVDGLQLSARETGAELRTALIERVATVARENLSDRIAWMAAKSVARGIAKRELTKQLEQSAGLGGRILGDVFAVVSERADLRCWQTLPDSWQACRLFVPSGRHTLSLAALGGESRELGCFQLEPGETMLVFARTVGGRLYAHPIGGTRLGNLAPMTDAEAAASAPAQPR